MTTCLIVDDDEIHREIAEIIVSKEGMKIEMAQDGEWALISCKRNMPDIIILDWMMPNMNGVEFLKELEKIREGNKPYVIMCTAKGDSSHSANSYLAGQSIHMGSMDFLPKPFHSDALKEKLQNALSVLSE